MAVHLADLLWRTGEVIAKAGANLLPNLSFAGGMPGKVNS